MIIKDENNLEAIATLLEYHFVKTLRDQYHELKTEHVRKIIRYERGIQEGENVSWPGYNEYENYLAYLKEKTDELYRTIFL